MKRLKITSALLSVIMCISMLATPITVIADETSSTSEVQTTEETEKQEPKETKKPAPKETEKQKPTETETEKQKPDESKVTTDTAESSEQIKSTETRETIKSTEPSDVTDPSESAKPIEPTEASKSTFPSETYKDGTRETEKNEPSDIDNSETTPSTTRETEESASEITERAPNSDSTSRKRKNSQIDFGVCGDNLAWNLTDDGTLTISGSGNMYNYDYADKKAPWLEYKDSIVKVVLCEHVTSIGSYSFWFCTKLVSVEIPDGLKSIGSESFSGCFALSDITLPGSIDTIGGGAFSGCSSLTIIAIPTSVKEIYSSTFYGCSSLRKIDLNSITSIGNCAFCSCTMLDDVTIPETVTEIGYRAFDDCTSLTKIIIPKSVDLNFGVFSGCTSLKTATFNGNLEWFPNSIFMGCTSLVNVNIPSEVTTIGEAAFYGCTSLTSIRIPDNVTEIGNGAFYGCSSLKAITLPEKLNYIGSLHPMEFDEGVFQDCIGITSIGIPMSVTKLGANSFNGCTNLTSITISKSLYDNSNSNVFENCPNAQFHFYSSEYDHDDEILLYDDTVSIAVGKTYKLSVEGPSDVSFKSSNTKIVKVDSKGTVTALKPGTVTITAYSRSEPNNSATCKVIVKYRINYVLNGGTNSSSNIEFYTGTAKLYNPTRTGYTFKGWFTSSKFTKKSKVTSVKNANKTLYAKWAANTYKVRYNKNGGSGSQSDQSCKYGTGYKINSCKFSRTGYTFVCWNTTADGSGQVYKPGDPIKNLTTKNGGVVTLYAQWSLITYKITYSGIPEGITNNNKTTYTVTTPTFTLEPPSIRENYTFKYWFVNVKKKVKKKTTTVEQKVTSIAKGSTGNKTIYAKWALNAYTIKFNANGGTGKMDNQSCNVTKEYKIRANAFSRKGWTFTGWNTKSDGSGTSYANNQSIMDLCTQNGDSIVLYAQWKINEYTITYNVPDGTVNNNKTTFTIETDTFELTAPSRPGHTFQYWYINVKKTKKVKKKKKTVTVQQKITSIPKGSTGNKTIYAKFIQNVYTVVFDANGGTGKITGKMQPQQYKYGTCIKLNKNTFKNMNEATGEEVPFRGWNTKPDGSGIAFKDGDSFQDVIPEDGKTVTLYAQWITPRDRAVSWVKSLVGQGIDFDHSEGVQCVDLIYCYVDYLKRPELISGDAIEFANKALPSGWSYVSTPQPGDIVIWDKGVNMGHFNGSEWDNEYAHSGYGHIGIVVEVKDSSIVTVEQNTYYAGKNASLLERWLGTAKIYIRPNYSGT